MWEQDAELVRQVIDEIWNGGDLARADVLFAPAYVNHGGLIPDLVHGPEAIKSAVALYRAAFPDFYVVVEALTAEDELVDLAWAAHGVTRTGPARARQVGTLRGTTRSRCADAQIAESWTTWDRTGVLERLGISQSDEEQARR